MAGCGTVTKTVYEPEYTTEKRTVERYEWYKKSSTKEVTVYKRCRSRKRRRSRTP